MKSGEEKIWKAGVIFMIASAIFFSLSISYNIGKKKGIEEERKKECSVSQCMKYITNCEERGYDKLVERLIRK